MLIYMYERAGGIMNRYDTDDYFASWEGKPVRCTPRSVLIVDDNDAIRRVFKRVLDYSLPECHTDIASSGAEAVRMFSLIHYEVVLMDLRMPEMDGDQAFHKIEQLCLARGWVMPKVVFCTGYIPSDHVLDKIHEPGETFALLHKPVDNKTLVSSVRAHLAA
jgi:CheY-like chemotaxis protein